jgi:hypothetical protein
MKQSFEIDVSIVLGGGLGREVVALRRELAALYRTTSLSRTRRRELLVMPSRETDGKLRSNFLPEYIFGHRAKKLAHFGRSGVARLTERKPSNAEKIAVSWPQAGLLRYPEHGNRRFWENLSLVPLARWKSENFLLRVGQEKGLLKKTVIGQQRRPASVLRIRQAGSSLASGPVRLPPRGRVLRPFPASAFPLLPEDRGQRYKPKPMAGAMKPARDKRVRTGHSAVQASVMRSRPSFGSWSPGQGSVALRPTSRSAEHISPNLFAQHARFVFSEPIHAKVANALNGPFAKSRLSGSSGEQDQTGIYPCGRIGEKTSAALALAPTASALRSLKDTQATMMPNERRSLGVPQTGAVYLDGRLVGRWVSDYLAGEAARAPSARVSFDARLGFPWPGPPIAY